jgi:hypothetical protein
MSAVPAGVACSQKQNTKQKVIEELKRDVFRVRQDVRGEKLAWVKDAGSPRRLVHQG